MHPVLFHLTETFSVHTYGVMIAVGTLLAVLIANRWARAEGLPAETMTDLGFWAIVAGVVGARLEYIRVNWHHFQTAGLGPMLNVRDGGLVFYGGLIGVLIAFVLLVVRRRLPVLKVLDIMAPLIPFGQMFGRLGCFAAGCCYGLPTDKPWAVTFTDPMAVAPKGIALHPTQLYAVGYAAALCGLLLFLRGRKRFDGQLILTYLTIYPILRSLNELVRGDLQRGFVMEDLLGQTLSNAQFISLLIAAAAAVGWVVMLRASKDASPGRGAKA
ncbi:MAG: prolipoprotein diacylglyceryl transferase [Alphaproteobacteria bacterium]|nr:prolipoprotein diacylglyceryl transferase [Alphaproteobacteria bacterium]